MISFCSCPLGVQLAINGEIVPLFRLNHNRQIAPVSNMYAADFQLPYQIVRGFRAKRIGKIVEGLRNFKFSMATPHKCVCGF